MEMSRLDGGGKKVTLNVLSFQGLWMWLIVGFSQHGDMGVTGLTFFSVSFFSMGSLFLAF